METARTPFPPPDFSWDLNSEQPSDQIGAAPPTVASFELLIPPINLARLGTALADALTSFTGVQEVRLTPVATAITRACYMAPGTALTGGHQTWQTCSRQQRFHLIVWLYGPMESGRQVSRFGITPTAAACQIQGSGMMEILLDFRRLFSSAAADAQMGHVLSKVKELKLDMPSALTSNSSLQQTIIMLKSSEGLAPLLKHFSQLESLDLRLWAQNNVLASTFCAAPTVILLFGSMMYSHLQRIIFTDMWLDTVDVVNFLNQNSGTLRTVELINLNMGASVSYKPASAQF
ncbi:hypothetical protein LTR62_001459 [Meristemomyces frigidus]|uniref:Uncharacterized protein n=1 Tax=Meristemomyces frigidus TaxID=1508187 RepID=A0AAN7TLR1_9PEZI|nr:hypothetical protein LTR62_001459 [Meristemomyces frigidus]